MLRNPTKVGYTLHRSLRFSCLHSNEIRTLDRNPQHKPRPNADTFIHPTELKFSLVLQRRAINSEEKDYFLAIPLVKAWMLPRLNRSSHKTTTHSFNCLSIRLPLRYQSTPPNRATLGLIPTSTANHPISFGQIATKEY
jgi:hypothetical protein